MPPKGKRNKSLGNRRPKKKAKIVRRNNATFNGKPKEHEEHEEPEEPEIIDDITETYEGTESEKLERQQKAGSIERFSHTDHDRVLICS